MNNIQHVSSLPCLPSTLLVEAELDLELSLLYIFSLTKNIVRSLRWCENSRCCHNLESTARFMLRDRHPNLTPMLVRRHPTQWKGMSLPDRIILTPTSTNFFVLFHEFWPWKFINKISCNQWKLSEHLCILGIYFSWFNECSSTPSIHVSNKGNPSLRFHKCVVFSFLKILENRFYLLQIHDYFYLFEAMEMAYFQVME